MPIKYIILIIGLSLSNYSLAQLWSAEQKEVIVAIQLLSASTALDGGGADAYGEMLTEDFSRWTVGSKLINNKADWLKGISGWFDEGWRVSDRQVEYIELSIKDDLAFTRRNVVETYLGPDGDSSTSKAAVAETWIKRNGTWLLLRVNVHPITE